ncbi:putative transmembrane protein [Toxoplasma gondii MAS]|uniref:Putative transmembrane protein n=1 Tax=Toxoplasma gondii MAS TaxID=943118 RepID=A0A086PQ67_TOXGO|nr:putative transmembrane protein [Toxoplasma gondii MAS]
MLHHVPKKAQESARGFSFCDRCGLPRGTKNCHACESLSLQPGQRQMNPQWEARDDHQIGHLLRHGQALSFFPPLQYISKTSHANAAFCCYPRYLEYCLELVEEKFAVVEEKLEMLMEFADSINKKRSSEEERRLASLDWMVKEVLKVQLSDFDVTVQRSKGIFYEDRWLTVRCIS